MDQILKLSLALALVTLLACQAISTAIHHVADVTGTAVAAEYSGLRSSGHGACLPPKRTPGLVRFV
jgi:hypothetical protein